MIAVQVAHQHRRHGIGSTCHLRIATIEEARNRPGRCVSRACEMETGVEAAAAAEGIAVSRGLQTHSTIPVTPTQRGAFEAASKGPCCARDDRRRSRRLF